MNIFMLSKTLKSLIQNSSNTFRRFKKTLISNKKLLGSHKQKFGGNLIRTKAVTKFKTSLIKVY